VRGTLLSNWKKKGKFPMKEGASDHRGGDRFWKERAWGKANPKKKEAGHLSVKKKRPAEGAPLPRSSVGWNYSSRKVGQSSQEENLPFS